MNKPQKFQETKVSSVSKKFSSDVEDQTDFIYSKQAITGADPKNPPLHVMPLSNVSSKEMSKENKPV